MDLKDRVAIITGSDRGIGKAIALALATEGCKVVICSRTLKELEGTKKLVEASGAQCVAVQCDVSNYSEVKTLVEKTIDQFGRLDMLINNAGILVLGDLVKNRVEDINREIATNLNGVIYCMKETVPHLEKTNGVIINISSGAGKHGFGGLAVYCATKFGVLGITESVAQEVDNVKIYAVCPGPVNTKMQRQLAGEDADLSHITQPEDVAAVVVKLCKGKTWVRSGGSVDVG